MIRCYCSCYVNVVSYQLCCQDSRNRLQWALFRSSATAHIHTWDVCIGITYVLVFSISSSLSCMQVNWRLLHCSTSVCPSVNLSKMQSGASNTATTTDRFTLGLLKKRDTNTGRCAVTNNFIHKTLQDKLRFPASPEELGGWELYLIHYNQ